MWGQFFGFDLSKKFPAKSGFAGNFCQKECALNLLLFFLIFQLHIFVVHVRVQKSAIAFQDEREGAVVEVDDVVLIQLLQAVLGDFYRAKVGIQNSVVVRIFRIICSNREHAAVRSAAAVDGTHMQRKFLCHPQFFQSLYGIFCECQFQFKSPLAFHYRA